MSPAGSTAPINAPRQPIPLFAGDYPLSIHFAANGTGKGAALEPMTKKRVLFVCVHNSARSQMAEAFLNALAPDRFVAESAGLEPGTLNLLVVEAMNEVGIDISGNTTKSVQRLLKEGRRYDYIITVCDEASAERCPVFPGRGQRVHMGFTDPSSFRGSPRERLEQTVVVRDQIKAGIEKWIKEVTGD